MREKLYRWMSEPVILPRWMLYLDYGLFALLGATVILDGAPLIDATRVYLFFYGLGVLVFSLAALLAVVYTRREDGALPPIQAAIIIECVSGGLLFTLLSVYITSTIEPLLQGDINKGSVGLLIILAAILPLFRAGVLGKRIINHWADRRR